MIFWSRGFPRSCDKLKPLCSQYHSAYGHQTLQDGDWSWGRLPIKLLNPQVTWSCWFTWQTKTIISPLPRCPLSQNLAWWWLARRVYSRPLLCATIAPNLVPWVLKKKKKKKKKLLGMVKIDICLEGPSKQNTLFPENVP